MNNLRAAFPYVLAIGDGLVFLVATLIGFATHGEALSWRVLVTFLPLCGAWSLVGPWLGVYRAPVYRRIPQVWRPVLAQFLAAPLAAFFRGLWLNTPILPVFVMALGASSGLGIGLWRVAFAAWSSRHG
jgi:hypothetical protein